MPIFAKRRRPAPDALPIAAAVGLGALLMYFVDDRSGPRRRAVVRDKSMRARNIALDALLHAERDAENRARGLWARWRRVVEAEEPVAEALLVERVRARIGHVSSHPHAIEVIARGNGHIELKGPILAREHHRVIAAASMTRGVRAVDDDMDVYASSDGIPSLQPATQPPRIRAIPSTLRIALGVGGATTAITGLLSARPGRALVGAAILLPAVTPFMRRPPFQTSQAPTRTPARQPAPDAIPIHLD